MIEPDRHSLTLRFLDADLEQAFLDAYARESVHYVRVALVLGGLVYGPLFGYLDWVQQSNALAAIWSIRAGVCGLAAGVYALTYRPAFIRWMQEILSTLIALAGVGLMAMILLDASPRAYLDGPVLLVLPGYVLMRIRFAHATVVGLVLLALYTLIIYAKEQLPPEAQVGSVIFLLAANIIGMTAGYAMETYARRDFWQVRVIDAERREKAELLDVKTRFFSNISHEIRTPLTLILGPLDDLLAADGAALAPAQRTSLETMRRNGRRLLHLMNQLLDLSRLDAQRMPIAVHAGDLRAFLGDIARSFTPLAERRGVALEMAGAPEALPARFDAEKVEVIVSNLLSNALKHTPAGGRVALGVDLPDAATVRVVVRDTGAGIPADQLPAIFERFHRVASATNTHPGAGIGLALTRALVERIGGAIDVESTPGFGSTFSVTLPRYLEGPAIEGRLALAAAEEEPSPPDALAPAGAAVPLGVALVIDDHPDVRAYVRDCLAGEWTVAEAADGTSGLALARQLIPDVIVTDLMMPEMDGMDLCAALREDDVLAHVPLIALTARADEASEAAGIEGGFDDYIAKPFDRRTFAARVRGVVLRYRALQEAFSERLTLGPAHTVVPSAERAFIDRLQQVLETHAGNSQFTVSEMAEEMGMSVRQLQRKVTQLTGTSPNAALRDFRLEKGRQLLDGGYGTVAEVAYAVGFASASYFTKCFRERYGAPPTQRDTAGQQS